MSDPAPIQTPPPAVPAEPAAKPKTKRNISDEERARRSARMKEISAKRIAEMKAAKAEKEPPKVQEPEPVPVEPPKKPAPIDDSDDDEIVERLLRKLTKKKPKAPKPEESSDDEDIVKPKKTTPKPSAKTRPKAKPRAEARPASPPSLPPAPAAPQKRAVRFF